MIFLEGYGLPLQFANWFVMTTGRCLALLGMVRDCFGRGIYMLYYIYILANETNVAIYVGVTNDLVRRVFEHKSSVIKGYTSTYNVDKLVYYEVVNSPLVAIEREKQIKALSRKKKNELVCGFNSQWMDLYDSIIG